LMLLLSILRCPDTVTPESRRSSGRDIVLGRGPECDWVLADPERVLSKRHCVVELRAGSWQLRDLSTNGTFINKAEQPIGRDRVSPLSEGDRIALGSYEFEVRIEDEAAVALATSTAPSAPSNAPVLDPFAPAPGSPRSGVLPGDWNPFAEDVPPSAAPFLADRNPALGDAFTPPAARTAAALPDDWDLDLGATPSAPLSATRRPSATLPSDWDPLVDLGQGARRASPAPVGPLSDPAALPASPPAATASADVPAAQSAVGVPGPGQDGLLDAFLRGAGIAQSTVPSGDPVAAMRRAGEALAAMVAGIRALLIARADVKREFRIEQTMLRRSNNDPLKFAATDEAALAALIGPDAGRRAVAATIDDLVAHQAASLAATQAAARAMLARLDPAAIEGEEQGGRIFGTREKRCWEAYKKLHADMMARFDDDFDGVFGKEFARAYEAASKR
jgi:type VI secretion system protein ImpI/type VI secretion system protein